jgi:hypothetical protein
MLSLAVFYVFVLCFDVAFLMIVPHFFVSVMDLLHQTSWPELQAFHVTLSHEAIEQCCSDIYLIFAFGAGVRTLCNTI